MVEACSTRGGGAGSRGSPRRALAAAYKAELRETEADATAAAGQVRRNMEAVSAQVQAARVAPPHDAAVLGTVGCG